MIMSEEYLKGFNTIRSRFTDLLRGEWSYLGILDFDHTYIANKYILVPENILLAIADLVKKENNNILLILNYNRSGEFNLIDKTHLDGLHKIVTRQGYHLFELSVNELNVAEKIRTNATNIIELKDLMAKVFTRLSERTNYISPKKLKISDLQTLSKFLIDVMGAPSIIDDLKKRAQNVVAQKGGTVKFAASLVSIPRLIEFSLMGISGFIKVWRLHKKDPEYREYLRNLDERAVELYNEEKLSKILSNEYAAFKEGVNVVVTDCFDKEYGFVIPLLILDFLKQFQNAYIILADVPDARYYTSFVEWLPETIEAYEARLVSYLPTKYIPVNESFNEYIKLLMNDKTAIFNLKADFFHFLHSGESIIVYSWLYDKFGQMEEERREGEYLFIIRDTHRESAWELMNVEKGSIERLKGFFARRE